MTGKVLEQYAKDIAKLTYDMEKICRAKEVYFCDSINLTPVEFRCLRYLLSNTFPQVKELASNMDLTPSRITNLLNSLENKEYVSRIMSKKDRRIIEISLTQSGKEYAEDIQDKYYKYHENILSSINEETKIEDILNNIKCFQGTLETFLEKQKM